MGVTHRHQCKVTAMINLLLLLLLLFLLPTSHSCKSKSEDPVPAPISLQIKLSDPGHLRVVFTTNHDTVKIQSASLTFGENKVNIDKKTYLAEIGDTKSVCEEQEVVIDFMYTVEDGGDPEHDTTHGSYSPEWETLEDIKQIINSSICIKDKEIWILKDLESLRREQNTLFNACFKELVLETESDLNEERRTSSLVDERSSLGKYDNSTVRIMMVMQHKEIQVYEGKDLSDRQLCEEPLSSAAIAGICVASFIVIILIMVGVGIFWFTDYDRQRLGIQKLYQSVRLRGM